MNERKMTLQELVEEGRRRIAAEKAAADAWAAAQPQREAAAVEAFRAYMGYREGVDLGDVLVVAEEVYADPKFPRSSVYEVTLIFPALNAQIRTRFSDGARFPLRRETVMWEAGIENNTREFSDLTAALLWLTDGQPLQLDMSEPLAFAFPAYAEA